MDTSDLIFLQQQRKTVAKLCHALREDRLAHGLLFTGPEGCGKATIARFLAQRLLCPQKPSHDELKGCGACSVCKRVWQQTHPDLHWLSSQARKTEIETGEKPSKGTELKIGDIRTLCQHLIPPPFEGQGRVAVILDAHQLTPFAANALLKTLEEPKKNTLLILIAPSKELVLPTLRSRLQTLRFLPLESAAVQNILPQEGQSPQSALQRSLESEGSVGQARNTASLSPEQTQDLLDILGGSHAFRVQKVSSLDYDRQVFNALLEGLLQILACEVRADKPTSWLPNQQKYQLVKLIEATLEAKQRAHKYGNVKLIAEKLFLHDFPILNV